MLTSTSYAKRRLTVRTQARQFMRLTRGSKTLDNHVATATLHTG